MSNKTLREYAKETAERWTNASKREKWGDISTGDVHNMLDTMIDGFEALEAQLAEAESLVTAARVLLDEPWWGMDWCARADKFLASHPEKEEQCGELSSECPAGGEHVLDPEIKDVAWGKYKTCRRCGKHFDA